MCARAACGRQSSALWVAGTSPPAAAADPKDALIQAQIAAGEFAPAVALAQQEADPQQRDAWLAKIAVAQASAGARDASIRSAAAIGDDRTRADTLSTAAAIPLGGQGGGSDADFESLMDLMKSTVAPATWDDVGGPGTMSKFPSGVYVNARGTLKPLLKEELAGDLAALRARSGPRQGGEDARRSSPLRMVSLTRLEKQVQLLLAAGRQPSEEMQVLAGLQRIEYVFIYPESGDLVLAGPAGDWTRGPENILVGAESGRPVVRLDDLVVVMRQMMSGPQAAFGCLIKPRQEGLARVQTFVSESNKRPIAPEQRKHWLEQLRDQVGKQDIEVYGLDPRHAGGTGDGRGGLSHETGGHGPGRRRARRAKLLGLDRAGPRAIRRRRWACCGGGSRSTTTPSARPRIAGPSPSAARV